MNLARSYLEAARVPRSIEPQSFGLWTIERRLAPSLATVGWSDYTLLRRLTTASLHMPLGEIVMEDSARELRRHLPIWMVARGRVLKTGLGLGCVVRGLLANPAVEHIDVVEIDADVIRIIGPTVDDRRVTIHHADAMTWPVEGRRYDYAWHDLHSFDDRKLALMHGELLARWHGRVGNQGAWAWPSEIAFRLPGTRLLGTRRTPANKR